jgi:hypothetical protein
VNVLYLSVSLRMLVSAFQHAMIHRVLAQAYIVKRLCIHVFMPPAHLKH